MPANTQANRLLKIATPLGPEALLLVGLTGREAISELYTFQLELLAETRTKVPFEKLLGQNVTVTLLLPENRKQYFNGIINRLTQGSRDTNYIRYRAEMVPEFWLWTKRTQSRIFQHLSIPDILKHLLTGLKVVFEFTRGNYQPRDYCVQYRESDFDFASRLMEDEGIYYFFKHADGANELVVTDFPTEHPQVPGQNTVIYDDVAGGAREDMRITSWEKTQELRSGKYTLWDHCFELPDKNLAAERTILENVRVGEVTHPLRVGGNEKLEIYDFPGGYAQRFDGVDKGGAPRPAELQKIFEDNKRTVAIRMEQEERDSLTIQGASNCAHFSPGHQFTLKRHFDADGPYLLTAVEHNASQVESYRSGAEDTGLVYDNTFTALPAAMPFRSLCVTAKPVMAGVQTATVVGPPGEEIFVDKYGRVKVQFHWDRQGKHNADSSCWIRVAQVWAGKRWGAFFWPRIGHEVVVIFEEGDPDRPLIAGSVYNAKNMPPLELPSHRTMGGIKSCIFTGNPGSHFNAVVFHDSPGEEYVHIHSEKHEMSNSETNRFQYVHLAHFNFHGDF